MSYINTENQDELMEIIQRVQQYELEILEEINRICRDHQLTCFAVGGSVLGAVRHGGFIPWDDDIDLGMPRQDYEKFLHIAAEELDERFVIQHFRTEPRTPFYFTKIRRNNTVFLEYWLKDYPLHHGIFVDIFPFDAVPENRHLRKGHYMLARLLYQMYLSKSTKTVYSSRLLNTVYETPEIRAQVMTKARIRRFLHGLLTPIPKKWIYKGLDACVRMHNGKPHREIAHIVRKRLRVKQEDLLPICYLPFENSCIPVPRDYDSYLRGQFGNYRALPPKDKRYGHLPYYVEFEEE